ncbi:hypothetical protein A1QO_15585 [Vibrio genomosp. F10 str. ZF-129]|uniref:Uncharacterized protein n=1 Tax=Vibrio genomosp. F10 str. ZF-129 TaxID=1187848 RepID=A0A1E5BA34_9VIBR|nr:hypothetical protein [Vibrio genomosp. F10]OEE30753.1 hypothetical protein A1QO_15585 [Vibrio genomosp. F10 str. ZF-129]
MENLENFLLNQSIEQINNRFVRSRMEQQQEMLIQLDAIAKKLPPIATHRPQSEVLADIKESMKGERARLFFGHSFVSWYRSGSAKRASQLHHWSELDMYNRHLFIEMLALRDLGRWDDEGLYQFEQYCLEVIGGSA